MIGVWNAQRCPPNGLQFCSLIFLGGKLIEMFLASVAGTLLGSLFEPLWWGYAFLATYSWKRGQPHIAWAGALTLGVAVMAYRSYPITLDNLPRYVGSFLVGPVTVLVMALVQRLRARKAARATVAEGGRPQP